LLFINCKYSPSAV